MLPGIARRRRGTQLGKEGNTVFPLVRYSLCAYFQYPLSYDVAMGVMESMAFANAK